MLKLVETQIESSIMDNLEDRRSYSFFDQLMAQVKYSHIEEVWQAQMKELFDLVDVRKDRNYKGHLRAL